MVRIQIEEMLELLLMMVTIADVIVLEARCSLLAMVAYCCIIFLRLRTLVLYLGICPTCCIIC